MLYFATTWTTKLCCGQALLGGLVLRLGRKNVIHSLPHISSFPISSFQLSHNRVSLLSRPFPCSDLLVKFPKYLQLNEDNICMLWPPLLSLQCLSATAGILTMRASCFSSELQYTCRNCVCRVVGSPPPAPNLIYWSVAAVISVKTVCVQPKGNHTSILSTTSAQPTVSQIQKRLKRFLEEYSRN